MGFEFFLLFFILGTFIGSFLNVLIDRIPQEQSVVFGRSYCDSCKHKLSWIDLIPIVSFIMLNGKCRYCRKKISIYYPIVETTTGTLFVIVSYAILSNAFMMWATDIPYIVATIYFLSIIASLITIFFIDLKYGIIPFIIVFFAVGMTFLWYLFLPFSHFSPQDTNFYAIQISDLFRYILSGIGSFAAFFLLFYATKGKGLGFGDVVYAFLMGLLLGFPRILLGLYIAFLTGAFISLILVLLKKKKLRGGTIPFGPFLVFGTVISIIWGQQIIGQMMYYLMAG